MFGKMFIHALNIVRTVRPRSLASLDSNVNVSYNSNVERIPFYVLAIAQYTAMSATELYPSNIFSPCISIPYTNK